MIDYHARRSNVAKLEFKKEQLVQKLKQLELLNELKGDGKVTAEDIALYNSIDILADDRDHSKNIIKPNKKLEGLRKQEDQLEKGI